MAKAPLGIPLQDFLREAQGRGLDPAALEWLLRTVQSPPQVTHLPALVDTLTRVLPLVARLDPSGAGAQAARLEPLLAALRRPAHRAWLEGLTIYLPHRHRSGGAFGGYASDYPVYACLVQDQVFEGPDLRTVAQALLVAYLLAPRPLLPRGADANAAIDAAHAIRKGALNHLDWENLLRVLPLEGDLDESPIKRLSEAFSRIRERDPHRAPKLRLLRALAGALQEPSVTPPPIPPSSGPIPPSKKPELPLWTPPSRRRRAATPPWPPEAGGRKGLKLRLREAPPPTLPPDLRDLVDPEGLAPEELGSGADVYSAEADEHWWEPEERALAFFGLRYATLLDHQHLIWRWAALNRHDLDRLSAAILADLGSDDPAERLGALSLGLSLVTGQDLPEVARLRLVTDLQNLPTEVHEGKASAVALAEGIWVHPTRAPEDGYRPAPASLRDLEPVVPWLRLPLPIPLLEALRNLQSALPCRLLDNLRPLGSDPPAALRAWLRRLRRRQPGLRATLSRVRDALFYALVEESADPVATAFTIGTTRFAIGSGRYYASFEAASLQRLYRRTLERALPLLGPLGSHPPAVDPPVGSRLRPKSGVVESLAHKLNTALDGALPASGRVEDLAAAHNAMTIYTLALLWYATGIRAVTDPFESFELLLPEADLGVVADKVHQRSQDGRPIVLCATAKAQLAAYQRHLEALSGRWSRHDAGLARRIAATAAARDEALWLFFLLEPKGSGWTIQPVTVGRIRDAFAEHDWCLPLNTQRHVLASQLRTLGVPAELIAGQLGHAQRGDHVLGEHSVLSLADLQPLTEASDQLLARLGWTVRGGIDPHRSRPGPDAGTSSSLVCVPGHQRRAERREGPHALRERLREMAREVAPNGSWSKERVEALGARLAALEMDPGELCRLETVAGRWLARRAPAALAASGWMPGFLLLPTPSPIDLVQLPLARRGLELEKRLYAAIDRDPQPAALESLVRLLVAAALDGLCNAARLRGLARTLEAGDLFGWGDRIWVECGREPFPRRWHPGFLPALLLVDWRDRKLAVPELARIERLLAKEWLPDTAPAKVFDELAAVAGALGQVRLPGYLAAYAREEAVSVSLPLGAWMRLLSGRPLASGPIPLPDPSPPAESAGPARASVDSARTRALWRQVRGALKSHHKGTLSRQAAIKQLDGLNDPEAAPVARALAAWAREMLARSRDPLAASTVREYILTVGGFLIAVAQDVDGFFRLEPDEYEDIYGRVLDLGRSGHRDYRARRLAAFHTFLEQHYGTPQLVTTLFRATGPGPAVDANLLTPIEYGRAKDLIGTEEALSIEQQRIATLSLVVLFRLGLRVGEWRRLRACDLLLPEPGVVLVRSLARGRTKTLQGQRQIPVPVRVPAEEWQALGDWRQRRHEAAGGKARLFELDDFDAWQYLTWAIRRVTGEPDLTLRHLRHAAATFSVLWADPPTQGLPDTWGDIEPDALRQAWFGEVQTHPTRRTLYQIATQHGHLSPATTERHYVHLLDWRLGEVRPVARLPALASVAALSGLSLANVRVLHHRASDDRSFAANVMRRCIACHEDWKHTLESFLGTAGAEKAASSRAMTGGAVTITLDGVAEVLDLLCIGSPPELVASRTLLPLPLVSAVHSAAKKIEAESGYEAWDLSQGGRMQSPKRPRNYAHWNQVRRLEQLVRADDPTARQFLQIWCARYRGDRSSLYVATEQEAEASLQALLAMGFDRGSLALTIPSNHPWAREPGLREAFERRLGWAPICATSDQGAIPRGGVRHRRAALGVALMARPQETPQSVLTAMRALHRACFLSCVIASLR